MTGKYLKLILIVCGIFIWCISTSSRCMLFLFEMRSQKTSWWGAHETGYGDLADMAYLDHIPAFHDTSTYIFHRPAYSGTHNIDLYVQGDSYAWKIPDSAYAGIHSYHYQWRYHTDVKYNLDKRYRSILVIEISERYARSYLHDTDILLHIYPSTYVPPKPSLWKRLPVVFNPNINQNIEYNLFNYNFLTPVKRLKASINYHLFGRASGNVVLAANKQQLFLGETVQGKKAENGYIPVPQKELSGIIHALNRIYEHYKQEGFSEIYLSIIPNTATILQPGQYNQFIPLIQKNGSLKMKHIDVYTVYKNHPHGVYRRSDTHWTNSGLQLWLAEVNKMLAQENAISHP